MNTVKEMIARGEIVRVKKSKKKIVGNTIYYLVGVVLSLIFLFPLLYMLATSTKTEEAYAKSAGTLAMFLPDFSSLSTMFDNYSVIFGDYGVWKYALNSIVYALIVIVLNVLVNGLAGYVLAKFRFPGKKLFTFLVLFLIVVPVETSMIPLYSIVKVMLKLKGTMSVLAVILPASISIFNIFLFTQFFFFDPERLRRSGADRRGESLADILPHHSAVVEADRCDRRGLLLHRSVERLSMADDGASLRRGGRMAVVSDSGGINIDPEHSGHHHRSDYGFARGDQRADFYHLYRRAEIYRSGIRLSRIEDVRRIL